MFSFRRLFLGGLPFLLILPLGVAQTTTIPPITERQAPRLEPVAETKLLMQGMTQPNIEGLAKMLKEKPTNAESWTFARGQALLIAESGNLLMMRPPKNRAAQDAWLARSTDLRNAATKLATAAGEKDYVTARAHLATVANVCNKCHDAFGVKTRVAPFE